MTRGCDMDKGCTNPVTHIGEKGYVYCAAHVERRRHIELERLKKAQAEPACSVYEIERVDGKPSIFVYGRAS